MVIFFLLRSWRLFAVLLKVVTESMCAFFKLSLIRMLLTRFRNMSNPIKFILHINLKIYFKMANENGKRWWQVLLQAIAAAIGAILGVQF